MLHQMHRDDHRHLEVEPVGKLNDPPDAQLIDVLDYRRKERPHSQIQLLCHGTLPGKRHLILLCDDEMDAQEAFTFIRTVGGSVQWGTSRITQLDREKLTPFAQEPTAPKHKGYLFRTSLIREGSFTCSFCQIPANKRLTIHVSSAERGQLIQLLSERGITAEPLRTSTTMLYVGLGIAACDAHMPYLDELVNLTAPIQRLYPDQLRELVTR